MTLDDLAALCARLKAEGASGHEEVRILDGWKVGEDGKPRRWYRDNDTWPEVKPIEDPCYLPMRFVPAPWLPPGEAIIANQDGSSAVRITGLKE